MGRNVTIKSFAMTPAAVEDLRRIRSGLGWNGSDSALICECISITRRVLKLRDEYNATLDNMRTQADET